MNTSHTVQRLSSFQHSVVALATILLIFGVIAVVVTSNYAPQVNWSPVGDWIVFSCSYNSLSDPQSFLYIVRPDGSSLQRISNNNFIAMSPSWSPEGQWISFRSFNRLLKIRPTGAEAQILTSHPAMEQIFTPVWSPNGEWIAYSTNNLNGSEIKLFEIGNSHEETVFHTDGLIGAMTWTSDNEQIIFTVSSSLSTSGIYILTLSNLETELALNYQHIMGGLDLSEDMSKLLITLFEGRQPNLFVYDITRDVLTSVNVPNFDGAPTWSAQEDWIVFRGYDSQNDEMQIYRARLDGQELHQITDLDRCYPSDPHWITLEYR